MEMGDSVKMEDSIEWEIVQEGGGNFLKTVCEGAENFADGIFFYQKVPGFLSFETRLINGKKESFYDITGKVSLAEYLREGRFRLAEIKNIFQQLLDMEEMLEQYLLEGTGLIIHEDFLYLERNSGRLWGIYQEGKTRGDMAALGTLLEYIMDYMEQTDRELVFFIYGMHKLTRGPVCTRRDVAAYLADKEKGASLHRQKEVPISPYGQKSESLPVGDGKFGGRKPGDSISGDHVSRSNRQVSLPAVTLLILGMAIPIILWRAGIFTLPLSGGMDWRKCLAATAFFLVIFGYGAWRVIEFQKRKARNSADVILSEEKCIWQLCLIPGKSGEELMPIGHYPFVLGSDELRADGVLSGQDVSGSHLQIAEEGGDIYAIDQESFGGTLRNGSRMVPWQKEKLKDGDILVIGSHEFVVELTSSEYVI